MRDIMKLTNNKIETNMIRYEKKNKEIYIHIIVSAIKNNNYEYLITFNNRKRKVYIDNSIKLHKFNTFLIDKGYVYVL